MTITQIKYFVEAAKCCNFRSASQNLYVSQQALSKQIKALEKEIGFALFERRKQRVFLTDAGKHMLSVWEILITEMEAALAEAKNMQSMRKVRIGIPDINEIINRVFPAVEAFSRQSEMKVEFTVEKISQLVQLFVRRELDILIVFHVDLLDVTVPFQSRSLQALEFGMICNSTHPFASAEHLHLHDLKHETILLFSDSYAKGAGDRPLVECRRAGFAPEKTKYFRDWKNMELALHQEQGVALTYGAFLPAYKSQLTFIPVELGDKDQPNDLVAAWYDNNLEELIQAITKVY